MYYLSVRCHKDPHPCTACAVPPLHAGQTFSSVTAFATAVARLNNPAAPIDEGWQTVYVEGVPLGDWRQKYCAATGLGLGPGGQAQAKKVSVSGAARDACMCEGWADLCIRHRMVRHRAAKYQ